MNIPGKSPSMNDRPLHGNTRCDDCGKIRRDVGLIRRDPYRGGVVCDSCYDLRGKAEQEATLDLVWGSHCPTCGADWPTPSHVEACTS